MRRILWLVLDLDVRPAPWRRNAPGTDPEAVRVNFIQSVVDLRRSCSDIAT